jgi:NADH-quinone oxidoreductase subunit A
MSAYLPILVVFIFAFLFALTFLGLSRILGPQKPTLSKLSVYECGAPPIGSARERFSVKFFLVAMLFIIFDIEIVFMYPWAVFYHSAIKSSGPFLFFEMAAFFVLLNLGLLYAWRKGALDWTKR